MKTLSDLKQDWETILNTCNPSLRTPKAATLFEISLPQSIEGETIILKTECGDLFNYLSEPDNCSIIERILSAYMEQTVTVWIEIGWLELSEKAKVFQKKLELEREAKKEREEQEELEREQQQRIQELIFKSRIPENDLYYATFDNFDITEGNREAFEGARQFVESNRDYCTLTFAGGTGLGKTHLAKAIGICQIKKGNSCLYYAVPGLYLFW